jgi:tetratricopeptide (TPR) repeat protein
MVVLITGMARASSYDDDMAALRKKYPADKLEQVLKEWREKDPGNPDAWILSASYYFNRGAQELSISTKPATEGDIVLKDAKSNKPAGSISFGRPRTLGEVDQAVELLRTAMKRWPDRLDIPFGLAYMFQETGQWEGEREAIEAGLKLAASGGAVHWCHGEDLPEPLESFLADSLHDYAAPQYRANTPAGLQHLREIAELAVKACPHQAKGYNDLAITYCVDQDWKGAQPFLEKAAEVDPKDGLVWMNLGDNFKRLGEPKRALETYQHVLKYSDDEEMKAGARQAIRELSAPATPKAAAKRKPGAN